NLKRRAVRSVLDRVYHCLVTWLAPVLCFTAEEAWASRHGAAQSVHEQLFPDIPAGWRDETFGARWSKIRDLRRVVTGALERARAEKKIGASLQAHPVIHVAQLPEELKSLSDDERSEIFITSGHEFRHDAPPADAFQLPDVPGVAVVVDLADGQKCER